MYNSWSNIIKHSTLIMDLRREFVVWAKRTAHHSLCEEELSEHAPLISRPLWHSIQKWLWYSTQVGKLGENE